jgi:hypothetical protein
MLELTVFVLLFLSSRFAEYAVLAIIMIYGGWSIFMKTKFPDVYLAIQEADDRRRAAFFATVGRASVELGRRISVWLDTAPSNRVPALPSIDVRTIPPSESGQHNHLVIIETSDTGG